MDCPLERWRNDPLLVSLPTPTLLLSRDLTIRAVSHSLLVKTGRAEADLVGLALGDAFPENPEAGEVGTRKEFIASVHRVLASGCAHRLNALRYDIEDPLRPGEFVRKRWTVTTAPIRVGETVGVTVQVEDVTFVDADLVAALAAAPGDSPSAVSRRRRELVGEKVDSMLAVIRSYADLASEVEQLRRALRSRPTIEQAKGIIMADRRCGPEQAFLLLRRLSNETNVRIADVAAAVVYQRSGSGGAT